MILRVTSRSAKPRANHLSAPAGAWENFNSIDAKYTFDSGPAISGELGRQSFGTTKATAMDAAHSDPPFTKAIDERLQDALRLIEGELKWLQRSV